MSAPAANTFAAGDHHRAGRVGGEARGRVAQLGQQRRGEGVDLGVVEGDDGDAVVASLEMHLVRHGLNHTNGPRLGTSSADGGAKAGGVVGAVGARSGPL